MRPEETLKEHCDAISRHVEWLRNANRDEEIQRLEGEIGELKCKIRSLYQHIEKSEFSINSTNIKVKDILSETFQNIQYREADEGFRHREDTTRKGPKVHSPVRDSQLKEPASTSSSNISDDIVEHDVHSDSMQLTKKHQTPGSSSLRDLDRRTRNDLQRNDSHLENTDQCFQEEKSILDQHGSDSEGQLDRSSWLTKTEPRESDDDSPGVLETFTPEKLELFKETRRRAKDSSPKPKSSDITELPRLRPNPYPPATFKDAHRRWTRGPSSKPDM